MQKEKYISLQKELALEVKVPEDRDGYLPKTGDLVFTFDIQYQEEVGHVAVDVLTWNGDLLGVYVKTYPVTEPYVPGLFAFREGPLLLKCLEDIQEQTKLSPQLLIVDGHGTAHPRGLGVACWLGLKAQLPTIGIAKEPLVKYTGTLADPAGSTLAIPINQQIAGHILRTQDGIRPVFVSPGHLISQANTIEVIMNLRGKYRHIEPIRRADQAARKFAKGEQSKEMIVLS